MVKLRRVFESELFLEAKKDLDDLKAYLGDKLFDDYMKIRDRIPKDQNDFKDFSKLKKMDKKDVQDFVNSFQSKSDKKKQDKTEGAEKLYEDNDWVVYRITTYPAAKLYGKGTKWCITGRYPGHEGRGEEYFNDYIEDNNLDGGYYFYITKDGSKEKYCVLQTKDKKIHSIWSEDDTQIGDSKNQLDDYGIILPQIPEVNIKNDPVLDLISAIENDNIPLAESIINTNINMDLNKSIHGDLPLKKAILSGSTKLVDLLIKKGAKLTYNITEDVLKWLSDSDMLNFLFDNYIFIDTRTLMYALRNYTAMRCILDRGYDPTRWRDSRGQNLLEYTTGRVHDLLEPYFYEES